MSGMDGCEVYDRLKEIKPKIKIIIFSECLDQYSIDELFRCNDSIHIAQGQARLFKNIVQYPAGTAG